jgi:flagellar biosynthetic protein FliR
VLVVLFLADLAMGLVSRAVPALNILVLSFPLKILLTLSLTSVAIAALPAVVSSIVDHVLTAMGSATHGVGG